MLYSESLDQDLGITILNKSPPTIFSLASSGFGGNLSQLIFCQYSLHIETRQIQYSGDLNTGLFKWSQMIQYLSGIWSTVWYSNAFWMLDWNKFGIQTTIWIANYLNYPVKVRLSDVSAIQIFDIQIPTVLNISPFEWPICVLVKLAYHE